MENSGAFWGEGSHVSSETSRDMVGQSQGHTGQALPPYEPFQKKCIWLGEDVSDSLTYQLIQRLSPTLPETLAFCPLFLF